MRKKKIILTLITMLSIIIIQMNLYAHSGRTDSSGGHKDNKNKSGLGSYHYHCGGHPAHLHHNGVCPYATTTSTPSSSSSSSTSTTSVPTTISVTSIEINENIDSMKVGESKILTATIMPSNATNKNITWSSSDISIATVSTTGEVKTEKSGVVEITASTSNGKTDTIKINIEEEKKIENVIPVKTTTTNKVNDISNSGADDYSSAIGSILTVGIIGGGGYLAYKKNKSKT